MDSPSGPPATAISPREGKQPGPRGRRLALTGAWLQLAPVFGIIISGIQMVGKFAELEASRVSDEDPDVLSAPVGETIIPAAVGINIGLVGWALILISLFAFRFRAAWLYWFILVNSLVIGFAFPIGTGVALLLMGYTFYHRAEFLQAARKPGA